MGLTREGFTPETYADISDRIKARLEVFSAGIDLSSESPDGHLVDIISFELSQAWSELNLVYNSYNPNQAVGAGLRNLGLITGLPYGAATRSQAVVNLVGTLGTPVPHGSIVTDDFDNEFVTQLDAVIPASVQVVATVSGAINIDIGAITTIKTPVAGWSSVTQTLAGREGKTAQTETTFRNLRNQTVLRNFTSVGEVMSAQLFETLGIKQVDIENNDQPIADPVTGTPANTIHVTVGEVGGVTDLQIGQVILATKGLACPTFGTTSVVVPDAQGHDHIVRFSKAVPVTIWMNIEVEFLSDDFAGAEERIRADLVTHINSLLAGEDVIWSRLFGIITPYAKAQVNTLGLSTDGVKYKPANIVLSSVEFATTEAGNIGIKVVPK